MENMKISYRTSNGEHRKIRMKQFIEDYREAYEYFYENAGESVPGYKFLVSFFDTHAPYIGDFKELVKKFCEVQHDFISSDREAAAFVAALGKQL